MLARTLLDEASLQAQRGSRRVAIVTAHAAIKSALAQGAAAPPRWKQLSAETDAVLGGAEATDALVTEIIDAAIDVVTHVEATRAAATALRR